jgi:hypothetical protein
MCTSLLNNPLSEAPQVHIIQEHSWRSPVVELDHGSSRESAINLFKIMN